MAPLRAWDWRSGLQVINVWSCTVACPTDLTSDGMVDTDDLLDLLSGWGTDAGDVTGDGMTDVDDLLAVLGAWGPCPN